MSWTDDFSHDYFADSTYNLIDGVEGTDFSIASSMLDFLSGGGTVTWDDARAVAATGWVEVTFQDATELVSPDTTGGNFALGLVDPASGTQVIAQLDTFGGYFFFGPSGEFIDSGGIVYPDSGPVVVRCAISATDVVLSVTGNADSSASISGSDADAMAAASPSPWTSVALGRASDVHATEWAYDVTPLATDTIVLVVDPNEIVADGTSISTATATITDGGGAPMPGETVTFTATGAGTFGTVTDHGDGTYSSRYTSDTTPGAVTVTAADASLSLSTTALITQLATAVGSIGAGAPQTGIVFF